MPTELCNTDVPLEKFPGKSGWTYALLPASVNIKASSFNMVRVSGQMDDYVLQNVALMALGKGRLFIPVRAEIRKQLGKQAGDTVRLVLHRPDEPTQLTVSAEDFAECLADTPGALAAYQQLPAAQQQAWVAWVSAAPTEQQQMARVETACVRLAQGATLPPV